jgi:glycosyltransferase involved in cell wall biosynthesis
LPPAPSALFVSYTSLIGGGERILLDCATALERASLACPEGPLADAARRSRIRVTPLRRRRLERRGSVRDRIGAPLRTVAQAREVRRAVRELRPDVVVAWSMRELLSSVLALRGPRRRPLLLFQHNDFLPGGAAGALVRRAARRADRVVCLSRAIALDLDPHGRPEVLSAGVDLDRFTPGPPPAGEPEVLSLGAIVAWKRPDLALETVARVPEVRLRLAGAPLDSAGERLLQALRERAGEPDLAGRVEFSGRLDDPREALRAAGCLLHCSDAEPYGLALVEALACGLPVVAAASGGPTEIVDGSCGALFSPGDPGAAADALRSVLADPALRTAARRRAEERYDLERTRERFRALIEELASG